MKAGAERGARAAEGETSVRGDARCVRCGASLPAQLTCHADEIAPALENLFDCET